MMRKIMVEIAPGELIDKITILEIKLENIHDVNFFLCEAGGIIPIGMLYGVNNGLVMKASSEHNEEVPRCFY